MLDERERNKNQTANLAKMFRAFTLDGDLDEGLSLQDYFDKASSGSSTNGSVNNVNKNGDSDMQHKADATADESWYLVQKIEKSLVRLLRNGLENGENSNNNNSEDTEALRKTLRKLKREMDEQNKELQRLRSRNGVN